MRLWMSLGGSQLKPGRGVQQNFKVICLRCSLCLLSKGITGWFRNQRKYDGELDSTAPAYVWRSQLYFSLQVYVSLSSTQSQLFDVSGKLWHRCKVSVFISFNQYMIILRDKQPSAGGDQFTWSNRLPACLMPSVGVPFSDYVHSQLLLYNFRCC